MSAVQFVQHRGFKLQFAVCSDLGQDQSNPLDLGFENPHTFRRTLGGRPRKLVIRMAGSSNQPVWDARSDHLPTFAGCFATVSTSVIKAQQSMSFSIDTLLNDVQDHYQTAVTKLATTFNAKPSSSTVVAYAPKQEENSCAACSAQKHPIVSQYSDDPWRCGKLLFAGVMSAIVTRTCMAPLERVKMDLVLKAGTGDAVSTAVQVFRTEGVRGFWKGNALNVIRTAPFKALNFFTFDFLHRVFVSLTGADENLERFAAGACAGMTATLVCFPLDVLRTRMMAPAGVKYGGPIETLVGMVKHEGPKSLYSGCLPAVVGMAAAGAVFYGVYDLLKHQHLLKLDLSDPDSPHHTRIAPQYTLLYGALAGASSELIVYPLEVLRRRMQLQSMVAAAAVLKGGLHRGTSAAMSPAAASTVFLPAWSKVTAACNSIVKTDGLRGFYSGMVPNMLQVLPSGALSYYTYDTTKSVLGVKD